LVLIMQQEKHSFLIESSNDVITQNGTTKGGIAGGWLQITAIANDAYYVKGTLLGSSTLATPFADS